MLFVKRSEVCGDHKRKVVGQPSDDFASIPHPNKVSHVLKLETTVSRTTRTVSGKVGVLFIPPSVNNTVTFCLAFANRSRLFRKTSTYLEVKPFPSPVDLNVVFRVKRADKGGRALEGASVDGGSEFVFGAESDFVHN